MNSFTRKSSKRTVVGVAMASAIVAATAVGAVGAGANLSVFGGAARNSGDQTKAVRAAIDGGRADNVILFIGDGMGDSEITSARNYAYGAGGRLPGIDALPLTGQYTTYSLTKEGKVDYVPDSAATGSAWATGTKTYDNAVSVDIHGTAKATLLELAKKKGYKTGNVTTSELQDATPAVQVSHISQRSCYGPVKTAATCPEAALENGGKGSITEQLIGTRPDVSLGGGATTFNEKAAAGKYAGLTLLEQAKNRGYNVVNDAAALDAVSKADQKKPLLGLFAPGNLPVNLVGPAATPTGGTTPAAKCTPNESKPAGQPSLKAMTKKAISLLDKGSKKGFFLQVEGASIDKQDHAANACGQIGEALDMDAALEAALKFAKKDKHTLVVVTADHGHTSQIVEAGSNTPGLTATLLTVDGSPMTIAYGTAPAGGSQQHTGTQVRIAGYGPQAANVVGLTDQTDLFFTIARALNLG
ncbi:alkaline phosphatase [Aeromicrobium panaciterrae]|uniref:Alkaline phosphatase n=1 Tax=Aeromicrobium panaciterrae TaxID=363861 RepID=A0ABU1UQS0_9ACTN|nr:alkaline phosphatase [Aeromicrobium panaciterrae]MDR7087539.1 alkaline phosphatase [Aeromicrobium panaciterrae]